MRGETERAGKTLVTGGGGFLGGAVVRRLVAAGTPVRTLSRRPLRDLERLGVEVTLGDLEDREAVLAACEGVRGVVHSAARPGIDAPLSAFLGPNVAGTRHVIDGCLKHEVPTLIHVSSPSVVFDGSRHEGADERLPLPTRGMASYPHSKLLAERDVLRADRVKRLRTAAVRPHLIWGPGDRHVLPGLLKTIRSGVVPSIGGADPRIGLTFIDNAAAAVALMLRELPNRPELAGRAYFLNDLPAVRLHDFVDRVASEAGLDRPARRRLPAPVATAAGQALTRTWRALRRSGEPPLSAFTVAQMSVPHWYLTDALRQFGEWETVDAEETWRRTRPFLRSLAGRDVGAAADRLPAQT